MPIDGKNYTDTLTDTEKAARDDLFLWLDRFPARVPALLEAVREGRVDGGTYCGLCRCVIGTLHNDGDFYGDVARELLDRGYKSYLFELPEIANFVWPISPGHTPANSPTMARLEEWIMQWQAA